MRERLLEFNWNGENITQAFMEWGDPENSNVLICVHGLTRMSRDFDFLADRLQKDYRVICPDIVGRGRSSWLSNKQNYNAASYALHIMQLLNHLQIAKLDWLGTSMGGLIGMVFNSMNPGVINNFIANDIGPEIPPDSILRIVAYASNKPHFLNLAHAVGYFKKNYSSFGIRNDAHWHHLAQYSTRQSQSEGLVLHYDPGIVEPFKALAATGQQVDLWPLWQMMQCRTMIIRGQNSDVLPQATLSRMLQKGGLVSAIEIPDTGHAPSLMNDNEIEQIQKWLSDRTFS